MLAKCENQLRESQNCRDNGNCKCDPRYRNPHLRYSEVFFRGRISLLGQQCQECRKAGNAFGCRTDTSALVLQTLRVSFEFRPHRLDLL